MATNPWQQTLSAAKLPISRDVQGIISSLLHVNLRIDHRGPLSFCDNLFLDDIVENYCQEYHTTHAQTIQRLLIYVVEILSACPKFTPDVIKILDDLQSDCESRQRYIIELLVRAFKSCLSNNSELLLRILDYRYILVPDILSNRTFNGKNMIIAIDQFCEVVGRYANKLHSDIIPSILLRLPPWLVCQAALYHDNLQLVNILNERSIYVGTTINIMQMCLAKQQHFLLHRILKHTVWNNENLTKLMFVDCEFNDLCYILAFIVDHNLVTYSTLELYEYDDGEVYNSALRITRKPACGEYDTFGEIYEENTNGRGTVYHSMNTVLEYLHDAIRDHLRGM